MVPQQTAVAFSVDADSFYLVRALDSLRDQQFSGRTPASLTSISCASAARRFLTADSFHGRDAVLGAVRCQELCCLPGANRRGKSLTAGRSS